MGRIHWSKIWDIMRKRDAQGLPVPFSMVYVKRSTGEKKRYSRCVLSSIHTKGSTVNIKIDGDELPQSFRKCLIIEINGLSVYL